MTPVATFHFRIYPKCNESTYLCNDVAWYCNIHYQKNEGTTVQSSLFNECLRIIGHSITMGFNLKVPDMIYNIIPPIFFKPTVILVPKVSSDFSDFCGEIWCKYSIYLRRNQWKCCLEIRKHGHHTKYNISTIFFYYF